MFNFGSSTANITLSLGVQMTVCLRCGIVFGGCQSTGDMGDERNVRVDERKRTLGKELRNKGSCERRGIERVSDSVYVCMCISKKERITLTLYTVRGCFVITEPDKWSRELVNPRQLYVMGLRTCQVSSSLYKQSIIICLYELVV